MSEQKEKKVGATYAAEGAEMNVDEIDVWGDESTVPRSAWFAFEKVGDAIQGTLMEEPNDREGKFGLQRIYMIKAISSTDTNIKKGDEIMVALKHTTHKVAIQQLKRTLVGDVLGFRFKEEFPTDFGNSAKVIEVRIKPINNIK